MKMKLVIAAVSLLSIVATAAQADPVYMLAQIQIDDKDTYFNKYGPAASLSLEQHGAKILVATPIVTQLEGDWDGNWTVIIEFTSEEKAKSWYYSDDYQSNAAPIRRNSTKFSKMVLAPGFSGFGQ